MLPAVPACMVVFLGLCMALYQVDRPLSLSVRIWLNQALDTMTSLQRHLEVLKMYFIISLSLFLLGVIIWHASQRTVFENIKIEKRARNDNSNILEPQEIFT